MSQTIYEAANINGREARKIYFLEDDGSKVSLPKNSKCLHKIGNLKFTANFKIGKCFDMIADNLECEDFYAPEDAVSYILSSEDAYRKIDPNMRTDGFLYSSPELDTDYVTAMKMDEVLDRYAWFVNVCHIVSEPEMLKKVIETAPKKKDGTFYKNRIVPIAAFPVVVSKYLKFYELIGKADKDTNITVTVQERNFSEENWMKVKDNRLLVSDEEDNSVKMTKFWHYSRGEYRKKKTTIEIQTVKMDDGRLAINAKPYRAISDFKCIKGDDVNGYEILEPTNIKDTQVIGGIKYRFDTEVHFYHCGIWTTFECMEDPILYLRTGNNKYESSAKIHLGYSRNVENKTRNLSETFFNEELYQLLCVLDNIYDFLRSPDIFKKIEYYINNSENGICNIPVPHCKDRVIPLVVGEVLAQKNNDEVVIFYKVGRNNVETWSEYEES